MSRSAFEPSGEATGWSERRAAVAHVVVDDLGGAGPIVVHEVVEHHLRRVLRVRDAEMVSLTDLAGGWRLATAVVGRDRLELVPTGPTMVEQAPPVRFTVASAIPKGDRLDWMVQKTAELGVDSIVLLHAERSVGTWEPDRVDTRLDRLRRIAVEACRQSRRIWGVTISAPMPAAEVLVDAVVAEPGGRPLASSDAVVAIGPEGGWTIAELEMARDRVSLGPNLLRVETAAVAATALSVTLRH